MAELLRSVSELMWYVETHPLTDLTPKDSQELVSLLKTLEYPTHLKPAELGRIRNQLVHFVRSA